MSDDNSDDVVLRPGASNTSIIRRIDRLDTAIHNLDQVSGHKLDAITAAVQSPAPDNGVNAKLDVILSKQDMLAAQLDVLWTLIDQISARQMAFFAAVGALAPPEDIAENIARIRASTDMLREAARRNKLEDPTPKEE